MLSNIIYIFAEKFSMLKSFFIIFSLLISLSTNTQEKYQSQTFEEIIVQTFTYSVKNGVDYEMDVYRPDYDTDRKRPVIIYLHGGGFSSGVRNSSEIQKFCRKLAGYGYVVA